MEEQTQTWDRTEFDQLLAEAKEKGYRKLELAELLGVAAPTFSNWISGKHVPHSTFQARFPELRRKLKDRRNTATRDAVKKGTRKGKS